MKSEQKTARILGVLFLYAFISSVLGIVLSGLMSPSFTKSNDLFSNVLVNSMRMKFSILTDLTASVSVIAMGVLLFNSLKRQNYNLAMIGLGLFFTEAIVLAISKISIFALLYLSREYQAIINSNQIILQSLGNVLVIFHNSGYLILQFFYSLGGIFFLYLFYKSKFIPSSISITGIIVFILLLTDAISVVLGFNVGIILKLPEALFEILIGIWLIFKGFNLAGLQDGQEKRAFQDL